LNGGSFFHLSYDENDYANDGLTIQISIRTVNDFLSCGLNYGSSYDLSFGSNDVSTDELYFGLNDDSTDDLYFVLNGDWSVVQSDDAPGD
jgi:hypothetical protein